MKKGFIYKLICPLTDEIKYVGKTVQSLKKRRYKHLYELFRTPSKKNSWLIKLKQLGLLFDVKIELIEECEIGCLNDREIFWIKNFKDAGIILTNMTDGGDCGSLGHKHSDEAKEKIRKRAKEPRNKMSDEGRKNISISLIGNSRHKGYSQSDEAKKLISDSKLGLTTWNAIPVIQMSLDDKPIKEWTSASDAANNLELSQGNIWGVIKGNRRKCGGFKWKLK